MLSLVGSLLAGRTKMTAVSQKLSLAGRKGRAGPGFAAKSEALVSYPELCLARRGRGTGGTRGDTGDTATPGTSPSRRACTVAAAPSAAHRPHSPRGAEYLTLKPSRWHLCRGRCRGGGVGAAPTSPRGVRGGSPCVRLPVHHRGVTGAAGGGDGCAGGRAGLGIGAVCVNPAGAGVRAGLGSSLLSEDKYF